MSSPHHRPLRLGTGGSPLALAQAARIAQQLRERCGRLTAVVTLATPGDGPAAPIERLGTTGVLTTTVREALPGGAVDLVVPFCKDLPPRRFLNGPAEHRSGRGVPVSGCGDRGSQRKPC